MNKEDRIQEAKEMKFCGYSNAKIAEELGVSVSTVRQYLSDEGLEPMFGLVVDLLRKEFQPKGYRVHVQFCEGNAHEIRISNPQDKTPGKKSFRMFVEDGTVVIREPLTFEMKETEKDPYTEYTVFFANQTTGTIWKTTYRARNFAEAESMAYNGAGSNPDEIITITTVL